MDDGYAKDIVQQLKILNKNIEQHNELFYKAFFYMDWMAETAKKAEQEKKQK